MIASQKLVHDFINNQNHTQVLKCCYCHCSDFRERRFTKNYDMRQMVSKVLVKFTVEMDVPGSEVVLMIVLDTVAWRKLRRSCKDSFLKIIWKTLKKLVSAVSL